MKGPDVEEEIKEAENAVKILGGKIIKSDFFELGSAGGRTIVIAEKLSKTPKAYPRQSSKIKSKPL